jgi:haloacetate dehalogenase
VLLLHGFPETRLMWHEVAPALTNEYSVVCADLGTQPVPLAMPASQV